MLDRETFDRMKECWGSFGSWAVWAEMSDTPKSNMGDISVLDPDVNEDLLPALRSDVVMVGLNISRPVAEPFRNFHDPNPAANDFKLRYAFAQTPYYGAYMTDLIKGVEMVEATSLLRHVRATPALLRKNVDAFLAELADLGSLRPTIVAFGAAAHGLVRESVPTHAYSHLIRLMHYANYISKEEYRRIVLSDMALFEAGSPSGGWRRR